MKTKIYLDVDGVLLTKKNTKVPEGAIELINYILQSFDCYWLTTHCRNLDTISVIGYLSIFFPYDVVEDLKSIKPVVWDALKTDGIDFNSEFYWLDDYPLEAEKKVLEQHGCSKNLIQVNLDNKGELFRVMKELKLLNENF